jgi:hypothetical protein
MQRRLQEYLPRSCGRWRSDIEHGDRLEESENLVNWCELSTASKERLAQMKRVADSQESVPWQDESHREQRGTE